MHFFFNDISQNDSEPKSKSNVYTIPQTVSFLHHLASLILHNSDENQIELTQLTLLLPTRRACRSMRSAFLDVAGGQATLLPKIQPIGEIDEDVNLLLSGHGSDDFSSLEVPPAIQDIERRLVLSQLVLKWSDVKRQQALQATDNFGIAIPKTTAGQANLMARELCSLMDEFDTEQVDVSLLKDIVPSHFSEHWDDTLQFLKIVTEMWPYHLKERHLTAPMQRRNQLIELEIERLKAFPPKKPIIAAGITGSIPAAAELLKVIASLPRGWVVLPGLDMELDDESWEAIVPHHPEHPQYGMKKLLDRIGVVRSDVSYLPGLDMKGADQARLELISETMRPSETTQYWKNFITTSDIKSRIESALDEHALITAPTSQDEAEVVSLILRHAAETPGLKAALVTPDRLLGRRVSTRLLKWGLMVDDSAGRPLNKTVPGNFMDLIILVSSKQFGASELMSLLKHPLCRLGMEAGKIRAAARSLEIIALRQPLAGQGFAAMRKTIQRSFSDFEAGFPRYGVMKRMGERDWQRALDLLDKLEDAFEPFLKLTADNFSGPIKICAEAHVKVAEKLALNHENSHDTLWAGEAGESLSLFFTQLFDENIDGPDLSLSDYPEFYRGLMSGQAMRPQTPVHPRLFIWGPLEARLQQPDIIILGGLNEGTWPQATEADAWLSRPMRQSLGLPAPEQRTGLFAHDFSQLLGAKKIYMTRAEKVDGVPTVPSRWLLRLQTLLNGVGLRNVLETKPDEPWLSWARYRDKIEVRTPVSAPNPCPPVEKRPRQLSVTQIEDWIKNPYVIFARNILRLDPLPKLGCVPDASLRGQVIHQALHYFTQAYGMRWPKEADQKLVECATQILADYYSDTRVAAFWQPRFVRFAEWFVKTEPKRRQSIQKILTEKRGELSFDAPGGEFVLTARADRLDLTKEHSLIIYDYKTGTFPKDKDVLSLKSPQLPLEATIALQGGFGALNFNSLSSLGYIAASGGEPPGLEHIVKTDDLRELAENALLKLKDLVFQFDKPTTTYPALRRSQFDYRYDDYEHLARVKEWSQGEDGDAVE